MARETLRTRPARRGRHGLTLPEVFVLFVIGVFLIALLLPTLHSGHGSARPTLCASRLSMMVKSMFLYAEDFNQTPPFILRDAVNDSPMANGGENRLKETWLAPAQTMKQIYLGREDEWPDEIKATLPKRGTLFGYTRFESLYRCPEFEHVTDPNKRQGTFNFTRSIMARKANLEKPGQFDGEILRPDRIHAPDALPMMIDEAWDCYVGWPEPYGWGWCGIDVVGDLLNNCLGQYHGSPVPGYAWYPNAKRAEWENGVAADVPVKRAYLGFYDGHVDLGRDPLPNLGHDGGRPPVYPFYAYGRDFLDWIGKLICAQQGVEPKWGP
jgi:hypothetical protein